jgi:hypothetical protein
MPPEHEARSRAFYDHEQDEPRGRRRNAVADWGVSEDVFDRMPGPRFSRRGEAPRRREEAPRARFVREEDPRVQVEDEVGAWLADEEEPVSRTIVIEREPDMDAEVFDEDPAPLPQEYEPRGHVAENGRRTFVIGGHPDRMPIKRTRPPRTAVERIGPRPDRIVGYAVAMGVLLILIAILTSS